jgi:LPS sulfotransferase NodH
VCHGPDMPPGDPHMARSNIPPSTCTAREGAAQSVSKSSVFICHTYRCGSTLLCDALSSTGVAGYAEEYFPELAPDGTLFVATGAALRDPDTWRFDWTAGSFEDCLERVRTLGTSQNGVFATKLKWRNMPYLAEMLGALPERGELSVAEHLNTLFPNLQYVWVTRRHKVRQAVSLVKARQTRQWKATTAQPQQSDPTQYNFLLVDLALREIVRQEAAWEEYFTNTGITPFTVVYEDLVRDYEFTLRRLLAHLRIELPSEYLFPSPRVHKQADAVSEEWVERYHRDVTRSRTLRITNQLPALLFKKRLRDTYVLPRLRARTARLSERFTNTRARPPLVAPQSPVRDNLEATHSFAGVRDVRRPPTAPDAVPRFVGVRRPDADPVAEVCSLGVEARGEGTPTHREERVERARGAYLTPKLKRRRRPLELMLAAVLLAIVVAVTPALATVGASSPHLSKNARRAKLSYGCPYHRAGAPTACARNVGRV